MVTNVTVIIILHNPLLWKLLAWSICFSSSSLHKVWVLLERKKAVSSRKIVPCPFPWNCPTSPFVVQFDYQYFPSFLSFLPSPVDKFHCYVSTLFVSFCNCYTAFCCPCVGLSFTELWIPWAWHVCDSSSVPRYPGGCWCLWNDQW